MQRYLFPEDLSNKKVLVSLSAGINSMAVLCYLASEYPPESRPKDLYIFYAHLKEHSPGSCKFVADGIRYAKKHFDRVIWDYCKGSVIDFFRQENMIPHPAFSPCSNMLKIVPINAFVEKYEIEVDLIGYVRTEIGRMNKQLRAMKAGKAKKGKRYLIKHLSDEDCFKLVEKEIGWYPEIYKILDENGRQVFKHNNCLPCKNMKGNLSTEGASGEFIDVATHFPEKFKDAQELTEKLNAYWGRKKDFEGHCQYCEF
jgi:hypothetical protein